MKFIKEYLEFINEANKDEVEFVKKFISNSLNGTYKWYVDKKIISPRLDQDYIPLILSKKLGIPIHTEWNIPFKINRDDLGNFLRFYNLSSDDLKPTLDKVIDILYKEVIKLNPELKDIKFNKKRSDSSNKRHVLYGAQTMFNIDDIKLFVSLGIGGGKNLVDNKYYIELKTKLENNIGKIRWIPSLNTLEKIREYLYRNPNI